MPPAAPSPPSKRAKLDAEPPATLSSPARPEAAAENDAGVSNGHKEEDSSDEEDEPVPEQQDFSRSDMYLDTVGAVPTPLMPGIPCEPRL